MNTRFFVITGVGVVVVLGIIAFITLRLASAKRRTGVKTAVKLADALRDERLKSEIIVNTIEDCVALVDAQKKIQLFNSGAAKITGWPTEEALSLNVDAVIKLVDEKDQAYPVEKYPFNSVFTAKSIIRDDRAILVARSNTRTAISLTLSPLFDEKKQVTAAVAIFRDVSQERAEQKRRGEFISTASHEMRTPVAAIEGYLALALNEKVSTIDSRARDFLEK